MRVTVDFRGCGRKDLGIHDDGDFIGVDGWSSEDTHVEPWELVKRRGVPINGWHNGWSRLLRIMVDEAGGWVDTGSPHAFAYD